MTGAGVPSAVESQPTPTPTPTHAELRHAFGCFPSGVIAVAALVDGKPEGLAASSFTSVSLSPPLVSVCIAHTSTTWPRLGRAESLGLSVLAEAHDTVARSLASKNGQRFAAVGWDRTPSGAILIHGSALWLESEIHEVVPAGDHDIVLLRVTRVEPRTDVAPIVFHGSKFRRLAS